MSNQDTDCLHIIFLLHWILESSQIEIKAYLIFDWAPQLIPIQLGRHCFGCFSSCWLLHSDGTLSHKVSGNVWSLRIWRRRQINWSLQELWSFKALLDYIWTSQQSVTLFTFPWSWRDNVLSNTKESESKSNANGTEMNTGLCLGHFSIGCDASEWKR